ncbi:MAG: D-2-hydroxyacid dehydrogenase, partial [Clostridia bacterium]|nr:D-2-hydroxyacid dehydrogenase [Clostridia bacterium]
MSKILLVDVRELTQDQRAALDTAARQRGYRAAFVSSEAEAEAIAPEAEIIFSLNAALLPRAPKLKWLCVPFAGVDAYLKPALEDRRDILLSSSSGAYGVTIAEHIVMVTLMLMR